MLNKGKMMMFKRKGNRLEAQGGGEVIQIEPLGTNCLRFRSTINREIVDQDWTLLPQPEVGAEINIGSKDATISAGEIMAEVKSDGRVRWSGPNGKVLIEELWLDPRVLNGNVLKARNYKAVSSDLYEIDLYFRAHDDERFYGMGQYANGCLNLKGCVLELAQKNTQISVPFLTSTRGYGFIWNNPSVGRAELAKNRTMWHAERARQIDYIVFYGSTPAGIVKKYMELTGKPPMLPEWAAGFWQSKLKYKTQEELLNVAREYRRRGLPLSVIVIDYPHLPKQGNWKLHPKYWPDPDAMVRELNEMNVKLMVNIWPTVDIESENYGEMVRRGLLVRTERGAPVISTCNGMCTYADVTNPEARKFLWGKIRENLHRHGIKMFWLDMAEPEITIDRLGYDNISPYDYDNLRYHLGNGLEVSNIYPFYYAKCFHDGLKAEGEKEIVNLVRCAWIGSQRLGVVVWSGDIPPTFESLRKQVKTGLSMAMAGIPWWTTDIGGFHGGDPDDLGFRELIVRWFQFGVFCPILRLHGFRLPHPDAAEVSEFTGGPNEIWSFGEEAYGILKELLFLRERIKPYVMEQMRNAHEEGIPVMRPLFFDFPEDEIAYEVEDEYMFGPDILVAPVLREGARSRDVYLPKGAKWKNADTDREYDGGQWLDVKAPLDVIPVFLKNGTTIPKKGE